MDCIDVLVRLADLASGRLSEADREALLRHLRDCPSCRAAARARLHAGVEDESRPILRRANERRPEPAAARTERTGAFVRVLQIVAILLLCAVCLAVGVTRGRWDSLLGLARWSEREGAAPESPVAAPEQIAEDAGADALREATEMLGAILFADASGAKMSARISEARLAARLREQRDRAELPAWVGSVFARLEAFFVRAAAAGDDANEWADLRAVAGRERLMRASEDARAYLRSPEGVPPP